MVRARKQAHGTETDACVLGEEAQLLVVQVGELSVAERRGEPSRQPLELGKALGATLVGADREIDDLGLARVEDDRGNRNRPARLACLDDQVRALAGRALEAVCDLIGAAFARLRLAQQVLGAERSVKCAHEEARQRRPVGVADDATHDARPVRAARPAIAGLPRGDRNLYPAFPARVPVREPCRAGDEPLLNVEDTEEEFRAFVAGELLGEVDVEQTLDLADRHGDTLSAALGQTPCFDGEPLDAARFQRIDDPAGDLVRLRPRHGCGPFLSLAGLTRANPGDRRTEPNHRTVRDTTPSHRYSNLPRRSLLVSCCSRCNNRSLDDCQRAVTASM